MLITDSLLTNQMYPGKLLFMKRWRENKVYSISREELIAGNYQNHEEVSELKFPQEVELEDSGSFYLFSF